MSRYNLESLLTKDGELSIFRLLRALNEVTDRLSALEARVGGFEMLKAFQTPLQSCMGKPEPKDLPPEISEWERRTAQLQGKAAGVEPTNDKPREPGWYLFWLLGKPYPWCWDGVRWTSLSGERVSENALRGHGSRIQEPRE